MKYLIGTILLAGLLWLTNPDEAAHKAKVKQVMKAYVTRLNQPFLASGNADSTARGLRAVQGFDLMADSMVEEMIAVENYQLFSFTIDTKDHQKGGIGILGKVYLFGSLKP